MPMADALEAYRVYLAEQRESRRLLKIAEHPEDHPAFDEIKETLEDLGCVLQKSEEKDGLFHFIFKRHERCFDINIRGQLIAGNSYLLEAEWPDNEVIEMISYLPIIKQYDKFLHNFICNECKYEEIHLTGFIGPLLLGLLNGVYKT